MRLILYTGKGGVGKTSLAASTAVLSADRGHRTLLVSSDLANNLSDIFQRQAGSGIVKLSTNLDLLEINILDEIRENWEAFQEYMTGLLSYLGIEQLVAEEVALFPGTEELFTLTRLLREVESGRYDSIIIDCAPTAGTMRLLTFTDSSTRKMNKLMEVERMILKLLRPAGKRFKSFRAVIPEDALYDTFGKVIEQIGRLGDYLKDPKLATMRLVLNPDPIALAETRRTYTYLALFGFPVDGIFVNKVLPQEFSEGYFSPMHADQQAHLGRIGESFMDTSIFQVPHYGAPPLGAERLLEVGREVFAEKDPSAILSKLHPITFKKEKGRVQLTFTLPGLDKKNLDIGRKENDLILDTGNGVRVVNLPDSLVDSTVEEARYQDPELVIEFSDPMKKT